ncbi:hypothetical protein F3J16_08320 [Burkholderia sp. Ap-962]|uniref:hypothetical protein n=1 Tax=Burkholderia sp. Ap-962 TaxID=2608333 RepID=UPI00141EA573|nr:hypothetical protein [Burkholderia sp. Ap-962]NIF70191.1 hypothetical protein [Burkholderia sp. Ap-962]
MIFELTMPGHKLVMDDDKFAWEASGFLGHIKDAFFCANIALCDFRKSSIVADAMCNAEDVAAEREDYRRRYRELYEKRKREIGRLDGKAGRRLGQEVELALRREDWARGIEPDIFTHKRAFINAKSFVYSLDDFGNFLKVLSLMNGVPPSVCVVHKKLIDKFPLLREVRNSAHHPEDRMRGGKKVRGVEQLIDIKLPDGTTATAPEYGIIDENLNGERFVVLTKDGVQSDTEVSLRTLAYFRDIFHEVANEFEWEGESTVEPR